MGLCLARTLVESPHRLVEHLFPKQDFEIYVLGVFHEKASKDFVDVCFLWSFASLSWSSLVCSRQTMDDRGVIVTSSSHFLFCLWVVLSACYFMTWSLHANIAWSSSICIEKLEVVCHFMVRKSKPCFELSWKVLVFSVVYTSLLTGRCCGGCPLSSVSLYFPTYW